MPSEDYSKAAKDHPKISEDFGQFSKVTRRLPMVRVTRKWKRRNLSFLDDMQCIILSFFFVKFSDKRNQIIVFSLSNFQLHSTICNTIWSRDDSPLPQLVPGPPSVFSSFLQVCPPDPLGQLQQIQ